MDMMRKWTCSIAVAVVVITAAMQSALAQEHHQGVAMPKPKLGESMPFVRLTDDGRLHMVFVDAKESGKAVRYRQMFGDAPVESAVSAPGDVFSHFGESPPIVEVMRDGAIHVLYTVRSGSKATGDENAVELRLATSTDGGRTWEPCRVIGDPSVHVYRACAAMREDAKGGLVMSWLEGHPDSSAIGVNTAVLRDGDIHYTFVDEMTCECCATELMPAADGAMWLAYRDKDEMNVRDMFLMRMTTGDTRFGPARRISDDKWVVKGCPEMGPRFAAAGSDTVWVAWFSGNPRGVYVSRAGVSAPQFAPREVVQAMDERYTGMGHPAVGTLPDGRVTVAYQCTKDGYQHIEGHVRTGDSWGDAIALGGTGEFPRIVSNGKKAYLVYTAVAETTKSISVQDLAELVPSAH